MSESVQGRPASGAPESRTKTPIHLWIVGVVALLWNLMGAFDYLATQTRMESYMSQFSDEQLAYFYGFPAWVVSCWAFAVWGGLAGAVGLLLRKRWAVWMFGISLVGMILTSIYNFVLSSGAEIMGTGAAIFTVVIAALAIFLLLYSRWLATKNVLT